MSKILLIGGTGFVGTSLVRELNKRPDNPISVIHKSKLDPEKIISGIVYHQTDLVYRSPELENIFSDKNIVVIMTQPDSVIMDTIIYYLRTAKNLKKILPK